MPTRSPSPWRLTQWVHPRGLRTQRAVLPAELTKRCSTCQQGYTVQRKCGDSGVLPGAHMGLPLLESMWSQQNSVVPSCRTASFRESVETEGHCCTWGLPHLKKVWN